MNRRVLRILIIVAATYAGVCLLVFVARYRLIFPLRLGTAGDPTAFGLVDAEPVIIPMADGVRISAWVVPPADSAHPMGAVIWFHGNGETVASIAPVLRLFRPRGAALVAVDYRGYGLSGGSPTPANTERDAVAIFDWLARHPGVDSTRILVYGRSIGTGPAVHLAVSRPVAGVVLESGFTSLRALARHHYPMFPAFLTPAGFDNLEKIGRVTAPILFIHGANDGIIPTVMGQALADKATAPREFYLIAGADHNETYDTGDEEYVSRFRAFVARAVTSP